MKKLFILLFCCIMIIAEHFSCINVYAKKFYVRQNEKIDLYIEEKSKIKLNYKNYKKHKIRFQSMNRKIATVNRKGIVTGKKPGRTIIKVYDRRKRIKKCKVKVTRGYTLSFPKASVELTVGQSIENQAIMSSFMNETIFYESSNNNVVEVDDEGNITAKGAGLAIITAEGIQAKAQCIVSVVDDIYNDMATFTAHRGYCEGKYKENTMDAFVNAVQNGFKGIETDIRVTADGEFVLSHDSSIWERMYICPKRFKDIAERSGNISMLTYDQLYELTDGKIVKLSDYLDYIKDKDVHSYLEIKELVAHDYPTTEMVINEKGRNLLQKQQAYQIRNLLTLIYNKGVENQVTISSGISGYLKLIREENNMIKLQYTVFSQEIDFSFLLKYNLGVDLPLWRMTVEISKFCKENGIRLGVYCADTREEMLYAMNLKVDNIMSNKCLFLSR